MTQYRFYKLNIVNKIGGAPQDFDCADDAAAMEKAKQLLDGWAIEVWRGDRLIFQVHRAKEALIAETTDVVRKGRSLNGSARRRRLDLKPTHQFGFLRELRIARKHRIVFDQYDFSKPGEKDQGTTLQQISEIAAKATEVARMLVSLSPDRAVEILNCVSDVREKIAKDMPNHPSLVHLDGYIRATYKQGISIA